MERRSKKLVAGMTAFGLVLTSCMTSVIAEPVTTTAAKNNRLWGANRYETAVEVSKAGWTTSDYVIIASGEDYPDALCAVPLAKKYDAPVLLTEKDKLNDDTKTEITRLKAKHVIIIGEKGAVSKEAEDALKGVVPAANVERIGGADRFETSTKVAEKLGKTKEAALVYGYNYADALSISAIAAEKNMPILLTSKDTLPTEVETYAKANKGNLDKVYTIGGVGVVSAEVSSSFAVAATATSARLGGTDRFDTNAKILDNFKDDLNYNNIYVVVGDGAKGDGFADALSTSSLAAKKSSPVVLTYKELNSKLEAQLSSQIAPRKNVIAVGGEAVLPQSVIAKVESLSVPAVLFSANDVVKGKADVTASNVSIEGKNVTLKDADVSGNVYIYGDGAKLTNVKVTGTVFVDPGENGSATLENVTAANIRVRSGAANSIHLKDVTAGKLSVESDNITSSVRVVAEGTTKITYTVVSSNAVLDGQGGSMGTITVTTNGDGTRTIELNGKFTEPVVVEGLAEIKVAAGAVVSSIELKAAATVNADPASTVSKVEINTLNTENITLAGKLPVVEVKTAAAIQVESGASIGSINVSKEAGTGTTVEAAQGTTVNVTGDGASSVKTEGQGTVTVTPTTPTPTTGGGGGYTPNPTTPTDIEDLANVVINKVNNYQYGDKKVSDYLTISRMTDKAMTITIKDQYKTKTAEAIFDKVEGRTDLESKLAALEGKLDLYNQVTIAGMTPKAYLKSKLPTYFNADGTLNKQKIVDEFEANDSTYDTLVDFAVAKMKNKLGQYTLTNATPAVIILNKQVTMITKDGTTLFNKNNNELQNLELIKTFVNTNNINRDSSLSAILGTYRVTIGTDTYTITVK